MKFNERKTLAKKFIKQVSSVDNRHRPHQTILKESTLVFVFEGIMERLLDTPSTILCSDIS